MNQPLRIDIYLDYVCPWCYIASARLLRLKEEYGGAITISWKSFPLDPYNLKPKFALNVINENRRRAGKEEPDLHFASWPEDKALPGSSMPAHEAAKCAQEQGREAFERYHMALLEAYSSHNRDISDRQVLVSLAEAVQLDVVKFTASLDGGLAQRSVFLEYEEALERGDIYGVPTVVFDGRAVLETAVPLEVYRQAVRRLGNPQTG